MTSGFFNNIRTSIEFRNSSENTVFDNYELQPIITVHDSNTNYIPIESVFDLRPYYDKYYTDFCHKIGPGIYLLFDLLVGYSYELANTLKQIDKDTIEFSGNAYSILKLYDKVMSITRFKVECDKTREEIENSIQFITDPYQRFILEQGCNMTKDVSSITVKFHRG